MYKLYWAPRTGSFAPEATLLEIGAAFETVRVDIDSDEQQAPAYKALNPVGQLPTLVLSDGTVMTESAAICLWLADAHPAAGLIPAGADPARARLLRWLLFGVCNIYESDLRQFSPARYTTDPDGVDGVREAAGRRMDESLSMLDAAIGDGPFLLGARYSVADLYIAMLACWHPVTAGMLASRPNLARLCDRTRRRPAVADALQRYDMARDFASLD